MHTHSRDWWFRVRQCPCPANDLHREREGPGRCCHTGFESLFRFNCSRCPKLVGFSNVTNVSAMYGINDCNTVMLTWLSCWCRRYLGFPSKDKNHPHHVFCAGGFASFRFDVFFCFVFLRIWFDPKWPITRMLCGLMVALGYLSVKIFFFVKGRQRVGATYYALTFLYRRVVETSRCFLSCVRPYTVIVVTPLCPASQCTHKMMLGLMFVRRCRGAPHTTT